VPAEVALQALGRIDDPSVLASVAQHRGTPKAVRQRARELAPADELEAPHARAGEVRIRQHEIGVQLQTFADTWDCDGVGERIAEATQEWQRLAAEVAPIDDVAARFSAAHEAALGAVASWERRRAEVLHTETTHEARVALAQRIEVLGADDDPSVVEEARVAWNALDPLPDPDGQSLARRFHTACEAYESRRSAWHATRTRLQELEAIVADATRVADATEPPPTRTWKAVSKRWSTSVPADDTSEAVTELRARFDAAAERIRARRQESERVRENRQRQNLARLEALCSRLDAAATAEPFSLRTAGRELRTAEAAMKDLGPLPKGENRQTWTERLTAAHDQVLRRFREAEEAEGWRRFANAGVQEELIRRVEALQESGDLAAATKALGEIQREWERVATAPREQSADLWNRYRTARNALRRRCDAYQVENLKQKQALCDAVAPLADSTDWKATAEEVKRLQAKWKAIGPVPLRHTESLWRRFREPCDRFFERRKEHFGRIDAEREENAKRKVALCEQAEALAGSKDWEATAAVLKRLQSKWKEIGPVPRADSEPLWQRFRGACDHFFDRRSRSDELEREEQVEAAETACAVLESSVAALTPETSPAAEELGPLLDAAWTALHALDDDTGADTRAIDARFRTACERLAETRPDTLRGTRVDPDATRGRREKICARLEALVEVALEQPRPLSLEDQALRLKEMLAAKTIGGSADPDEKRRADAAAEIARLRTQWARLGPPLGEDGRTAAERFARACARFDAGPPTPAEPAGA
jgi:phage host-nuclease inhibitor protein Gam